MLPAVLLEEVRPVVRGLNGVGLVGGVDVPEQARNLQSRNAMSHSLQVLVGVVRMVDVTRVGRHRLVSERIIFHKVNERVDAEAIDAHIEPESAQRVLSVERLLL